MSKGSYFSRADGTVTFLIDKATEIQELWNDKRGVKIQESYFDIKGLPIKYTHAPRFKFITDRKSGGDHEFTEH